MLAQEWNWDTARTVWQQEERERVNEEWQVVVADKDAEIADKDAEIADKDAEIADKDAEIAALKAKLRENQQVLHNDILNQLNGTLRQEELRQSYWRFSLTHICP